MSADYDRYGLSEATILRVFVGSLLRRRPILIHITSLDLSITCETDQADRVGQTGQTYQSIMIKFSVVSHFKGATNERLRLECAARMADNCRPT